MNNTVSESMNKMNRGLESVEHSGKEEAWSDDHLNILGIWAADYIRLQATQKITYHISGIEIDQPPWESFVIGQKHWKLT